MQSKARLHDVSFSDKGKQRVVFELEQKLDLSSLDGKDIRLEATQWREKRSLDANGLLWSCLQKIAQSLNTDKWSIYLMMLKRYGQFTYVVVPTGAVEQLQQMWRETEVVGEIDVNGRKATQVLCYFGSSTYDSKQFSVLMNGVKSEMEEMGIPTPDQEDMDRALAEWEKSQSSKAQSAASSAEVSTN